MGRWMSNANSVGAADAPRPRPPSLRPLPALFWAKCHTAGGAGGSGVPVLPLVLSWCCPSAVPSAAPVLSQCCSRAVPSATSGAVPVLPLVLSQHYPSAVPSAALVLSQCCPSAVPALPPALPRCARPSPTAALCGVGAAVFPNLLLQSDLNLTWLWPW